MRYILALALVFMVTACSGQTATPQATPEPTATPDDLLLMRAFWIHHLTANRPTVMLPRDYGAAPALCQGVRFFATEASGGAFAIPAYSYAFVCDDLGDMATLKGHYDKLSRIAGMYAMHTYAKGHYLAVIDGNIPKATADKYGAALP